MIQGVRLQVSELLLFVLSLFMILSRRFEVTLLFLLFCGLAKKCILFLFKHFVRPDTPSAAQTF